MTDFIECGTASISYNIMGIATVSYSIVTDSPTFSMIENTVTFGNRTYSGYVMSAYMQPMPNMTGEDGNEVWYTINVTMVATT